MSDHAANDVTIPRSLHRLFWDLDPDDVRWEDHRDFVIRRVLAEGGWEDLLWIRRQLGGAGLAAWLVTHNGRGLSARQLRFWQVVLELDEGLVDGWVARERRGTWASRTTG